jgi:dTDP-6-deoxy-L-talose 4-dehydrogenase (NAD+)
MKIVVTGATGFIGFHVRRRLALTDNEVVLGVRDLKRLGELAINETPVEMDISQEGTNWFEIFGKPDAVLHLAWGGLPNYMDQYHVDVELPMQIKFLNDLLDSGLKKLVVTGTCYEYGLQSGALAESHDAKPNTAYGIAKDRLRRALFEIQQKNNFDLTWARLFYPFGVGQSENSLYTSILREVSNKKRKFLLSSGDSILDFISVSKVSEILLCFILNLDGVGVVNVGSGKPLSVVEFAQFQAIKNSWDIDFLAYSTPQRDYESKQFWADTTYLKNLLVEAMVDLE